MEILQFPILLPLITSIFFILVIKNLFFKSDKLPPGPWKLPIIGSMHHLIGADTHRRLSSLADTYGPIFRLKLGELNYVIITSSELAGETMKTHDMKLASRPPFLAREVILYNADMVFEPHGLLWSKLRKICTVELFSAKRVKSFVNIMEEEGNNIVERIRMAAGSPVNVTDMLFSVASATLTRAAFGKEYPNQEIFFTSIKQTFNYLSGFYLADLYPSLSTFLGEISGFRAKLEKVSQNLDAFLNETFKDHIREKTCEDGMEDLVDVLLRLMKNGELDESINMDNIKGLVLDLFLGGTETPAATMEWAMTELVRHPEVMQKAQLEVRNAVNGKAKIEEKDISNNLPYLNMVIKETLRLRSPAPLLVPRYCSETIEIGGYTIPAKSRVVINAWAIMRDKSCWADAETFQPERFEAISELDSKWASNFQFIPFGGGRRICPGINFGMTSMENVLANLLYHFDWSVPGGKGPEELDVEETFGLSLTRKHDLMLVPTPHKYN